MAEPHIDDVPHIAEDGSVSYVRQGLGWRLSGGEWPGGDGILTHGGHSGARLWVDPRRGLAFAFMTTLWGVSSEGAIAVLEAIYAEHDDGVASASLPRAVASG